MRIIKPKYWDKKNSLISFFLIPFSIFFQILVFLKSKFTKEYIFSIPVICVGNIYVGGTGKTPLSIKIAKILKKLNKKVAIIKKSYREHDDEFKLINSNKVKLFKNTSRVLAINEAIDSKFDCVIMDDGFQDRSIKTNLNIICFAERQLFGNGMTLPSGPLREPLTSIKKSQIVVINGKKNSEFENKIKNISSNINIYYSYYLPTNLINFKDHKLLAFAGIGNPENFFSLLKENNLNVVKKMPFPDHYNYSINELNEIVNFSLKNNLKIITTEKDFFRIKHFQIAQIKCLNVELKILNSEVFEKDVIKYL
jgi:tetraacyldisaccharide 4'-kinase